MFDLQMCHEMLNTFNSLYEILTALEQQPITSKLDFQFSLWDSVIAWVAVVARPSHAFNSLYEILYKKYLSAFNELKLSILFMRFNILTNITCARTIKLSILFMRFEAGAWPKACRVSDFQFSLWDSKVQTYPIPEDAIKLSILFMRFPLKGGKRCRKCHKSFNSLYEIPRQIRFS